LIPARAEMPRTIPASLERVRDVWRRGYAFDGASARQRLRHAGAQTVSATGGRPGPAVERDWLTRNSARPSSAAATRHTRARSRCPRPLPKCSPGWQPRPRGLAARALVDEREHDSGTRRLLHGLGQRRSVAPILLACRRDEEGSSCLSTSTARWSVIPSGPLGPSSLVRCPRSGILVVCAGRGSSLSERPSALQSAQQDPQVMHHRGEDAGREPAQSLLGDRLPRGRSVGISTTAARQRAKWRWRASLRSSAIEGARKGVRGGDGVVPHVMVRRLAPKVHDTPQTLLWEALAGVPRSGVY
jgi:hypothetical protein